MWVKIEEWVGVGEYVFLSFSFFNDVPEVCVCVCERERQVRSDRLFLCFDDVVKVSCFSV